MLDLNDYGTSTPFKWTHAHLVRTLSTGRNPIITNPIILDAFNKIDRQVFVPDAERAWAYHDKPLPIGFGESMISPSTAAIMLEGIRPQPGENYLHLGSGSGYLANLLAYILGVTGRIHSLERVLWLWEKAKTNTNRLKPENKPVFLLRDGQFGLTDKAPYDGIILTYSLPQAPERLKQQLKTSGGKMILPLQDNKLYLVTRSGETTFSTTEIGEHFIPPIKIGLA